MAAKVVELATALPRTAELISYLADLMVTNGAPDGVTLSQKAKAAVAEFGALPPFIVKDLNPGCLAKAKLDEPLFILRGQDALAPRVIENWAHLAAAGGCPQAKVDEALDLAGHMRDWQKTNGSKKPD